MGRLVRSAGFYFILILVVLFLAQGYFFKGTEVAKPTFNEFLKKVEAGEVKSAVIYDKDNFVKGVYKDKKEFQVGYQQEYPILEKLLSEKVKVEVNSQKEGTWLIVLTNLLPFVLIIAFWFFIMQQMQGGGSKVMSFGKARAKGVGKDSPRTTFKDVAGLDEAIEELQEIKEFLENPTKFQNMGAKIPKGVLLFGPPGSGKTLLARAIAGEAGVPFFSISGSDFVEMFVGVGASRVRDLFEQAKAVAPALIFIDEIDAVGRQRGAGLGGGHDEREQTLNQLLVEMDGFEVKDKVIMIAATNRPDILDPALLRPGRFDRQIVIDRPDLKGRTAILQVHAKNKPVSKEVDLEVLARRTPGFTGADLANLVNEAALLAARHNKKEIDMVELEESIDRVLAGPERKNRLISDKEKAVIAYHEAGHALVAHMLPNTDPVHKITIIPRGRALGYTLILPLEDRYLVSKSEMLDQVAVSLGGRVAEKLVYSEVTTGAHDDLDRASKLVRKMICEYGMSEKLGPVAFGQKQESVFLGRDFANHPDYSDEIAYEIDKEVRRVIDEGWERAEKILTDRRPVLDTIAQKLIESETLEKEELIAIFEGNTVEEVKAEQEASRDAKKEALGQGADKEERVKVKDKIAPKLRPAES